MERKHLKRWLIAVALLYLVFPRDLVPDFVGRGLGLLDDLLVIAGLSYFYRTRLPQFTADAKNESKRSSEKGPGAEPGRSRPAFDPYAILGIPPAASQETIRRAYRKRMGEYHPDKVAHLGEDLQKLAHEKVLEIQKAYRQLES